jgi:hypothetical protein
MSSIVRKNQNRCWRTKIMIAMDMVWESEKGVGKL